MSTPDPPLDFAGLRFEPLAGRPSKVRLADLGRPGDGPGTVEDLLEGLPAVLAAPSLKQLRDAIVAARAGGRPVLAALGGHVIKTGCGPYLNDWIERGILTGVAMNGSAAIHDLELAIAGHTSEDVGPRLAAGTFGFARETSELFVAACDRAAAAGHRAGCRPGRGDPRSRRAGARRQPAGHGAAAPRARDGPRRDRDRHRAHDAAAGRRRSWAAPAWPTSAPSAAWSPGWNAASGSTWAAPSSCPKSSSRPSPSPATWASPWTA